MIVSSSISSTVRVRPFRPVFSPLLTDARSRGAGKVDGVAASTAFATVRWPGSYLSFGLFQDPETPENRDFLVYLGLLGLRGSSGTAQKQPESTKLGPRESESLVGGRVLIAGEQHVRAPRRAAVDLSGHFLGALDRAGAGDD